MGQHQKDISTRQRRERQRDKELKENRKLFDFYKRYNYLSMGKSKRFNQIQCKEDLRKTELIIRNQEQRILKVAKRSKQPTELQ